MPQPKRPLGLKKPQIKDSIDIAKRKSLDFAKKRDNVDMFNNPKKFKSLTDSVEKYSNTVVNPAKEMSKDELKKRGISKKISPKGDTTYSYGSNNMSLSATYYKKK